MGTSAETLALRPPSSFSVSHPRLLLSALQVCVLPKQPSHRWPGHFCYVMRSGSSFPKALSGHELTLSSGKPCRGHKSSPQMLLGLPWQSSG